jgi:hypothetical protein
MRALTLPARLAVALGLALVTVAVAVHLVMVFLHIAPQNALSEEHSGAVDAYVYPEFEQNWKLFAPNPLQQNIAVEARALVAKSDGDTVTTRWSNLSAQDGADIHHNIAPSHTQQNELRRAWEFFRGSHDQKGRSLGTRGDLSERYVKRIVMNRFGSERDGGTVERIQVRSATRAVRQPPWSRERTNTKTQYAVEPWWPISSADLPGGRDK